MFIWALKVRLRKAIAWNRLWSGHSSTWSFYFWPWGITRMLTNCFISAYIAYLPLHTETWKKLGFTVLWFLCLDLILDSMMILILQQKWLLLFIILAISSFLAKLLEWSEDWLKVKLQYTEDADTITETNAFVLIHQFPKCLQTQKFLRKQVKHQNNISNE